MIPIVRLFVEHHAHDLIIININDVSIHSVDQQFWVIGFECVGATVIMHVISSGSSCKWTNNFLEK